MADIFPCCQAKAQAKADDTQDVPEVSSRKEGELDPTRILKEPGDFGVKNTMGHYGPLQCIYCKFSDRLTEMMEVCFLGGISANDLGWQLSNLSTGIGWKENFLG